VLLEIEFVSSGYPLLGLWPKPFTARCPVRPLRPGLVTVSVLAGGWLA